MTFALEDDMIAAVRSNYKNNDPSHDILHMLRVLQNVKVIQKIEGGDMRILGPAAIFHDAIKYDPSRQDASQKSALQSATLASHLLRTNFFYNLSDAGRVERAIIEHSATAELKPSTLESAILQDADRLERTGAVGIARVFASTGSMNCPLYHETDPLAEHRNMDRKNIALDYFMNNAMTVTFNTKTAYELAKPRLKVMQQFLDGFAKEIGYAPTPAQKSTL